jgi:hypothetical protein
MKLFFNYKLFILNILIINFYLTIIFFMIIFVSPMLLDLRYILVFYVKVATTRFIQLTTVPLSLGW